MTSPVANIDNQHLINVNVVQERQKRSNWCGRIVTRDVLGCSLIIGIGLFALLSIGSSINACVYGIKSIASSSDEERALYQAISNLSVECGRTFGLFAIFLSVLGCLKC